MNSCILMAEIYDNPQLRHTPDGLEVTEMIVHVPGIRPDDPSHPLKVVGWGNLAKEIHQTYHQGDRVIIEGRLGMNTIDRPEGFKEKRAELTVQRIHSLGQDFNNDKSPIDTLVSEPGVTQTAYEIPEAPVSSGVSTTQKITNPQPTYQPTYQPKDEIDPDDIPF